MSLFANMDPAVKRDIKYIAMVVAILTVLMEAVFLIIGQWNVTVLFGGLLGAAAAKLNFVLMAHGVQKSLEKEELLQTIPQGAVFCNCTNGDKVLLLNNETVVRFSHEEPEALTVWENIHQFIYEAITDNY